jgi:hypothetical protein
MCPVPNRERYPALRSFPIDSAPFQVVPCLHEPMGIDNWSVIRHWT